MIISDKHRLFAKEYVKEKFNGTRAYLNVYKDIEESTARVNASKLLTDTNIQALIEDYKKELNDKVDVSIEYILNELKNIVNNYEEKTNDRVKAIELLGKYKGAWIDRLKHEGEITNNVITYVPDNKRN